MLHKHPHDGLTDKIAVVTGGGSGIGAAVCEHLSRSGCLVEVFDIDVTGDAASAHRVDVSHPESVYAATEEVLRRHGRCDVIVNVAGVHASGDVMATADADWHRLFAVNVDGVRNICRALLPHLSPQAAIVNVASAAGLRPNRDMAAYTASKAALIGLTRAMAVDHAEAGVRVNCVCPGLVDTPMLRASFAHRSHKEMADVESFANYLIKRAATPDEIAAAVAFLASDAATYITGAVLAVDGGRTLH